MLIFTHRRTQLCRGIVTAAGKQDRSFALLNTLITSLLISFSSFEVVHSSGKAICSAALLKAASLSRMGYLEGSSDTAQLLIDLVSEYTVLNNVTSAKANTVYTQYPVDRAVCTRLQLLYFE